MFNHFHSVLGKSSLPSSLQLQLRRINGNRCKCCFSELEKKKQITNIYNNCDEIKIVVAKLPINFFLIKAVKNRENKYTTCNASFRYYLHTYVHLNLVPFHSYISASIPCSDSSDSISFSPISNFNSAINQFCSAIRKFEFLLLWRVGEFLTVPLQLTSTCSC